MGLESGGGGGGLRPVAAEELQQQQQAQQLPPPGHQYVMHPGISDAESSFSLEPPLQAHVMHGPSLPTHLQLPEASKALKAKNEGFMGFFRRGWRAIAGPGSSAGEAHEQLERNFVKAALIAEQPDSTPPTIKQLESLSDVNLLAYRDLTNNRRTSERATAILGDRGLKDGEKKLRETYKRLALRESLNQGFGLTQETLRNRVGAHELDPLKHGPPENFSEAHDLVKSSNRWLSRTWDHFLGIRSTRGELRDLREQALVRAALDGRTAIPASTLQQLSNKNMAAYLRGLKADSELANFMMPVDKKAGKQLSAYEVAETAAKGRAGKFRGFLRGLGLARNYGSMMNARPAPGLMFGHGVAAPDPRAQLQHDINSFSERALDPKKTTLDREATLLRLWNRHKAPPSQPAQSPATSALTMHRPQQPPPSHSTPGGQTLPRSQDQTEQQLRGIATQLGVKLPE